MWGLGKEGGRRVWGKEFCKRPFVKGWVTQPRVPSLVPADRDPPKPIIQMEKEEKMPKKYSQFWDLHSWYLFFVAVRTWMRITKREGHLYFSSGFKKLCLVWKDYIQCGSGPTAFARTWLLSTPSTGKKLHLSGVAGGPARGCSFTGPQAESPVPSCVARLHRSGPQLASC